MNDFLRPEQVERIRQQYPAGTRICCDNMPDDPQPIEPGTLGTVRQEYAVIICLMTLSL